MIPAGRWRQRRTRTAEEQIGEYLIPALYWLHLTRDGIESLQVRDWQDYRAFIDAKQKAGE